MQPKYFWIDLETTGLEPDRHHILEFAVVITGADLQVKERAGGVLRFNIAEHAVVTGALDIDPFVYDMHAKNGLWNACQDGLITVPGMEAFLIELVDGCAPWAEKKPILAGSTPHFDRSFIKHHCPELDRKLHYRHFDVSTLKMAVRDALDEPRSGMEPESRHRADSDLEHSLQVAREFQKSAYRIRSI